MSAPPITFDELPSGARAAIEAETGPILNFENVSTGLNSSLSALTHTAGGVVFLKGLRADHRWVWTQQREADINPYVTPLAPRLLFHVISDGWNVLGFETIEGHHADYSPGSPDLPKVTDALRELASLPCPDIELRHAEQRLAHYVADPAEADAFAGDTLLHTDWNNHNVLITDDRAHLVDWGWATRGAAWLDPAHWIIWLIAAGHTPAEAEELAGQLLAWTSAPPRAVDTFAHASTNLWTEIAGANPDDWTKNLVTSAQLWQQHRQSRC
ncbi:aminoglycoside phosphotransferase [Streptomyces beijiangensis]|uniref:Aminoglycoside phosphotransferase n=1 Tax=Streptomyces beijiangensis TaxID=163361 RepID=A0A939F5M2_9ACTN|nr:aminoglycoside phosphotransferase [Streptomyces beijiangensis]MBO0511934.1 aminoglycoside phosphotransferase [Streptomyces beijiangensis]